MRKLGIEVEYILGFPFLGDCNNSFFMANLGVATKLGSNYKIISFHPEYTLINLNYCFFLLSWGCKIHINYQFDLTSIKVIFMY